MVIVKRTATSIANTLNSVAVTYDVILNTMVIVKRTATSIANTLNSVAVTYDVT